MRATFASTVAAAAVALAAGLGCHAASADDFASHVTVTAIASAGKLHLTLAPKDGWMVNTAYPGIKVTLKAPKGVTLGKTTLGHHDATYQGKDSEEHAASAVFTTTVKGKAGAAISGTYKMVICSKDSCSPPFHGSFSVTPKAPGA